MSITENNFFFFFLDKSVLYEFQEMFETEIFFSLIKEIRIVM